MNDALTSVQQLLDSVAAWWTNIALVVSNLATIEFSDIYTAGRWCSPYWQ